MGVLSETGSERRESGKDEAMRFTDMLCLTALLAATVPAASAEAQIQRPPRAAELIAEQTIECPAQLPDGWGLGMTLRADEAPEDHQYIGAMPEGWEFQAFNGYTQWTYVRTAHGVIDPPNASERLICSYGLDTHSGPITVFSLMRAAPGAHDCSAADDFRFTCRRSRQMFQRPPGDGE